MNEFSDSEILSSDKEKESGIDVPGAEDDEGSESTASEVKEVVQELLRQGYIEEARKPVLFRGATLREREVRKVLEPLDLAMRLDTHRGVAFLIVASTHNDSQMEGEEWRHPLIRRQRLTLEQSMLVAILRQEFVRHEQEVGVGAAIARVAVDELLQHFLTYFEDSGSDAKNESRLANLLDQLKTYGIVSEIDKNEEFTIRPLIAHLANPESLAALLEAFQEKAKKGVLESEQE